MAYQLACEVLLISRRSGLAVHVNNSFFVSSFLSAFFAFFLFFVSQAEHVLL